MVEMMRLALAVGVGGFFGAMARFGTTAFSIAALGPRWPVGTLVANSLGCLLLGWLRPWQLSSGSPLLAALVLTGFCGSYTTFSTFLLETNELTVEYGVRTASLYAGGSLLLGGLCLAVGLRLGAAT